MDIWILMKIWSKIYMFLKLSFKKSKLKREKTTFTDQQPYHSKINLNPWDRQFYFLN